MKHLLLNRLAKKLITEIDCYMTEGVSEILVVLHFFGWNEVKTPGERIKKRSVYRYYFFENVTGVLKIDYTCR